MIDNKPDERFTDCSFADLIALRQETLRSNREIPDRTSMEFVKDIDKEMKRRNNAIGQRTETSRKEQQ